MTRREPLHLLPPGALVKTNDLDQGEWSYGSLLAHVMRIRFRAVRDALATRPRRARRLVEIGYGSGLFLPELARWCDELHGLDLHDRATPVRATLARNGVDARLARGSVTAMPYRGASFDAVIALSTFEFVDDLTSAAAEVARVLAPGGVALVVTPGRSPLLDLGLRVLTGERGEDTFEGRRERVVPALSGALRLSGCRRLPALVGAALPVYRLLELRPRA